MRDLKIHFIATYQRYDGILWPELVDTGGITVPFIKINLFGRQETSDSAKYKENFINVKDFSLREHKQYRKDTLMKYLNVLSNFAVRNFSGDPVQFVRTVVAIYLSVHNCYLYYDDQEKTWNFGTETSEVRYSQLFNAHDILMTVMYLKHMLLLL